jgi:Cu2+-exporting ATPase
MITGESLPVEKAEGDGVIAGTVNGQGSLRVEVTGTGEKTALAGIMRLVAEAQASRSHAQALADRAAYVLTVVAIVAGVLTLVVWLLTGADGAFAIERLVAVLVIACPHALGLAIPLVVAISTTLGAQAGLLVRDRRGLEEARLVDTVVFDKTGTLTRGEFRVVDIATNGTIDADRALALAASAERDSEHSIALGIVRTAEEKELAIPQATDFEAVAGHGVRATVDGRALFIGGPAMLQLRSVTLPEPLRAFADTAAERGQATVHVIDGNDVVATLAVADAVREESIEAVRTLRDNGIEVVMLTGDAEAVAHAVAHALGITTVLAQVLPDQKADRIRALQRDGRRVAMVGDGVNDAPALARADVGIAIGTGADVALEASDVTLVGGDLEGVATAIRISRSTVRVIRQNLFWAFIYNVVGIPIAAGVLYPPFGVLLSPVFASAAMAFSSVSVVSNSLRLRGMARRA